MVSFSIPDKLLFLTGSGGSTLPEEDSAEAPNRWEGSSLDKEYDSYKVPRLGGAILIHRPASLLSGGHINRWSLQWLPLSTCPAGLRQHWVNR